ncbi:MAG: DUF2807 domain-containing protein [Lewinellaceae bacterium]|nr:DUF2807 domain-containing protein [Lewinellaceae bacterium]
MEVGGRAQSAFFDISGSGDIQAKKLEAGSGKANIAGSGSVTCNMKESLKANIAGSGDIFPPARHRWRPRWQVRGV